MMNKKLKLSKYCNPSKGLVEDNCGLVHLTTDGYNLLVELLEEKAQQKIGDVKE